MPSSHALDLARRRSVARSRDRRAAFLLVTVVFGAVLLGANLPTALYGVYREQYGFSTAVLTLAFATYALVLAPSLILFGQLSDRLGRRLVLLTGLAVASIGLCLFAAADGTPWLFAARAAQGLAVGIVNGTATAALVELEPARNHRRAALMSGLAQAGGSAAGALVGGVVAEWAPDRLASPYLAGIALTALAACVLVGVPESAPSRGRSWRIERPGVPAEIRGEFARVALTAACVWSVAALFLSVVPSYTARLLHTNNLALLAALAASMLATSCVAMAVAGNRQRRHGASVGLVLVALGLLALVLAFPAGSLLLVLAAGLLAGAGQGLAFLDAQNDLNRIAPDDRRGEISAAFATVIYLGVAAPVIGVGLLGLAVSLFAAVAVFAAVMGSAALLLAATSRRPRRRTSRPR